MFQQFRRLQAFTQKHFPCLQSPIDNALIVEIGYYEEQGRPLTIKGLLLLKLGAPATVRRRLQRLVDFGLVHKRRASHDRRICHLEIDPAVRMRFARYLKLILRL
jgi:DNA-binding MarR family transcriptional regulator